MNRQIFFAFLGGFDTHDKELVDQGNGLQQVSQAQSKLAQAEANWRNANTAPKQMTAMRAKAASAEAEVQRKKADLDQAQLNLQYTKIVAPVAGVVSDRTVEERSARTGTHEGHSPG